VATFYDVVISPSDIGWDSVDVPGTADEDNRDSFKFSTSWT
jgi:hypothetical protein